MEPMAFQSVTVLGVSFDRVLFHLSASSKDCDSDHYLNLTLEGPLPSLASLVGLMSYDGIPIRRKRSSDDMFRSKTCGDKDLEKREKHQQRVHLDVTPQTAKFLNALFNEISASNDWIVALDADCEDIALDYVYFRRCERTDDLGLHIGFRNTVDEVSSEDGLSLEANNALASLQQALETRSAIS